MDHVSPSVSPSLAPTTTIDSNDLQVNYTTGQKVALAFVQVLPSFLSLLGSTVIMFLIMRDRKNRLSSTYHRLVLGMSSIDAGYSSTLALSVLMIPKGDPYSWGAQGNQTTCNVAGFFGALGGGTAMYNASLSIYYLLVIRFNVKDRVIAHRWEPIMHTLSYGYPLSFAILGLVRESYRPLTWLGWCFHMEDPDGCGDDANVDCIRPLGNATARDLRTWNLVYPGVASWLIIVVCMVMIYLFVRGQEQKMRNTYASGMASTRAESLKRTRQTVVQAFLYVGALFLTVLPIPFQFLGPTDNDTYYFAVALVSKFMMPLQGWWNFLIYIAPRVRKIRNRMERKERRNLLRVLWLAVVTRDPEKYRNTSTPRSATAVQSSQMNQNDGDDARRPRPSSLEEPAFQQGDEAAGDSGTAPQNVALPVDDTANEATDDDEYELSSGYLGAVATPASVVGAVRRSTSTFLHEDVKQFVQEYPDRDM